MPVKVPWSKLIRFVSVEDDHVHYGNVLSDEPGYDVGAPENQSSIKAELITGNPFGGDCKMTGDVARVKKLLGPFTPSTMPAIRCIGGNYAQHLKEVQADSPRFPCMFPKLPNAITGYGDNVEIPKIAQDDQADYEIELTVVIGKDARNVAAKDAYDYVLGYTVANDVSARKWQMDPELVGVHPPPQISFSKSFDGFCPIGPCIVSAELIEYPHGLSLSTKVNGEIRQNSSTDNMIFKIPQIIEFCSQGSTLQAGSVILTGTPSGVGFARNPPQWLKPGDKVEMTIGKIGTLVHGITYA